MQEDASARPIIFLYPFSHLLIESVSGECFKTTAVFTHNPLVSRGLHPGNDSSLWSSQPTSLLSPILHISTFNFYITAEIRAHSSLNIFPWSQLGDRHRFTWWLPLLLNQQPPCSSAFFCSPGSPLYTPWNLVQKTTASEAYLRFHRVPHSSAGGRGPEYA